MSHIAIKANPSLAGKYTDPSNSIYRSATYGSHVIPSSLGPYIRHYSIICEQDDRESFFFPIVRGYILDVKLPKSCELCERSQFALTSHHLVPQSVFKTLPKEASSQHKYQPNTAWLCRGCHRFLHRIITEEALAKDYCSIELLLRRTEIWQFARTVGRLG